MKKEKKKEKEDKVEKKANEKKKKKMTKRGKKSDTIPWSFVPGSFSVQSRKSTHLELALSGFASIHSFV